MTPDQIALIRSQFAQTRGMEDAFAGAFYARLFHIAPALRRLFPHDLSQQGQKLMKVMAFAVNSLDRPEALAPAVRELGARHVAYDVTEAHFAPVGAALIDTLATALGPAFTAEARAAWETAVAALAGLMAEGMQNARAAA